MRIITHNIVLILISFFIWSNQVTGQFFNDFETDQLNEWNGDVQNFYVDDGRLILRAPDDIGSTLYRKYKYSDSLVFSIDFNMDFAPSSSNSLKLPIISSDTVKTLNGYFLYVGESGSEDALLLVKVVNGAEETLLRLQDGSLGSDPAYASLEIERYMNGIWNIKTSYATQDLPQLEMSYQEDNPIFMDSAYFMIECNYTSSRRNSFSFDNIGVQKIVPDEEPPFANKITVTDNTTLTIAFNEVLDSTSAVTTNHYKLSDATYLIDDINLENNNTSVRLSLSKALEVGKNYSIMLTEIADKAGNRLRDTSLAFINYDEVSPDPYDLIITELMPNPQSGGIPAVEYVEIHNRSDKYITTKNLSLSDRSSEGALATERINPGEYVILCETKNVSILAEYGKVIAVSSWPSLNNTDDSISIIHNGVLLHSVNYSKDWYRESSYYNSGYSLELHDQDYVCFENGVAWWEHEGDGFSSPGTQNVPSTTSIDADISMKSVFIEGDKNIVITVNSLLSSLNSGDVQVTSGNNTVSELEIFQNKISILLSDAMIKGEDYELQISLINDCVDKLIYEDEIVIGLPSDEEEKEVCISEIMFDPASGEAQWIEINNSSEDYYDFSDLYVNIYKEGVRSRFQLGNKGIFFPGAYVILCKDCDAIKKQYNLEPYTLVSVENLTSLDRTSGQATVTTVSVSLDSIAYDADWHDPLLKETKGVSLARISCGNEGTSSFSWYSSSSSIGYASPGKGNEIEKGVQNDKEILYLVNSTVSPDGDGYEDLLIIGNNIETENARISIKVYDLQGSSIKTLTNNKTIAQGEIITWAVRDDNQNRVLPGMYIIVADIFNSSGYRKKWKTSFSVVR